MPYPSLQICMKEPKCKLCGGPHYKTWCRNAPKKPLARTAIKRPSYEEALQKARKASQQPRKVKPHKVSTKPSKPLKRSRIASQGKNYRATLIRQADRIFSLYIRRKDAVAGTARCVTCGKRDHYKAMQNGHYVSRRKMVLRYDEKNCHVQCPNCNMNLGGNLTKYKHYLIDRYGADILFYYRDTLIQSNKLTTVKLQQIIDEYTVKLNNL